MPAATRELKQARGNSGGGRAFSGRRGAEVAAVSRLVRRHCLVTVTGPVGIGKTRLAVHAGASLVNTFTDGAWLVGLTWAGDPEAVAALTAEVLRIDVSGSTDSAAVLAEALRVRATLLILDNFEHGMDAASAVSTLLAAAPDVHVLATAGSGCLELPIGPRTDDRWARKFGNVTLHELMPLVHILGAVLVVGRSLVGPLLMCRLRAAS